MDICLGWNDDFTRPDDEVLFRKSLERSMGFSKLQADIQELYGLLLE